jgi:exodeoxyribonuclease VII large subunit
VPSIISALEKIYLYEDFFDVVVIIRGGGATADLNCFDNYDLALNITQFPLPVITGIGHEKDETIADKVAHTRLKTPTAVAEFLINGTERFYENLSTLQDELVRQTEELIEFQGSKLEGVSNLFSELTLEYIRDKSSVLIKHGNRLNKSTVEYTFRRNYEMVGYHHKVNTVCAIHRIENQKKFEALGKLHETLVRDKISAENKNLTMIQNQIIKDVSGQLKKLNGFIQNSENMLNALSPGNVLKRGYSLTFKNGKLLKSVKSLTVADEIETWFSIGSAKSIITEKQVNHE